MGTPRYAQSDRFLRITTPLGTDALLLVGITGREAVSEPFSFSLDLLADARRDIPFDRLLGQAASVRLLSGDSARHLHGVIARLVRGTRSPTLHAYRATLVPAFALLARRVQSRVFQSLSVPDILKQVMIGFPVRIELTGEYPSRDYCVQYQESDFAFASRLMEEEGIWYRFDHADDSHTLVLADASPNAPLLQPSHTLVYDDAPPAPPPPDRVTLWETAQEVRSSRIALWDYAFQQPATRPDAVASAPETVSAGTLQHALRFASNESLEVYDGPGGYAKQFDDISPTGSPQPAVFQQVYRDNARVARLRSEEEAARGLVCNAAGTGPHLSPGHRFDLTRHPDADGSHFLVSVTHTATLTGDYRSGQADGVDYRNTFASVPADLVWRPERKTPRPQARGVETAIVVGPTGTPIYTDRYGRVKVRFLWDRDTSDGVHSSCWVRVGQSWAGQGWGSVTLPRVGQEVIVGFRHGDPDMPIVLGSVYNGEQSPPFPLPENASQSGIKSSSLGSTDPTQFSGLGIEDSPNNEHVHLHSQKYLTHSAEESIFVNAGSHHHTNIGSWCTRIVGGLPGVNHSLTVGAPASAGSGSGSGDGGDDAPYEFDGPFQWNPDVLGGIANDLNVVFGFQQANTVGLLLQINVGQYNMSVINPLALATAIPGLNTLGPSGSPGVAALWGSLFNATTTVVLGGIVGFAYGPKVDIHRGYSLALDSEENTKAGILFATLYSAMMAIVILEPLIPGVGEPDSSATDIAVALSTVVVLEALVGLWTAVEAKAALAQKILDEANSAEEMLTVASNAVMAATTDTDKEAALQAAADLVAFMGQQGAKAGEASAALIASSQNENSTLNQGGRDVYNGTMYNIYSPAIRLVSMIPEAGDPDNESSPFIGIQAVGRSSAGKSASGYTYIYGDTLGLFGGSQAYITAQTTSGGSTAGTVSVVANNGGVNLLFTESPDLPLPTEANVYLNTDGLKHFATNTVAIQASAVSLDGLPQKSGYLELNSSGSVYLYGQNVTVGNYPSSMNTSNTQVTITVGNTANTSEVTVQAGNAKVTFGNNSLTLTVGTDTSASFTNTSITLKTSGSVSIQGSDVSIKGDSISIGKGE